MHNIPKRRQFYHSFVSMLIGPCCVILGGELLWITCNVQCQKLRILGFSAMSIKLLPWHPLLGYQMLSGFEDSNFDFYPYTYWISAVWRSFLRILWDGGLCAIAQTLHVGKTFVKKVLFLYENTRDVNVGHDAVFCSSAAHPNEKTKCEQLLIAFHHESCWEPKN